jgi:hypothetical protein
MSTARMRTTITKLTAALPMTSTLAVVDVGAKSP